MVIKEIECVVCGTVFTFDVRGRAPVTCSPECSKKRMYERNQKWRETAPAAMPESAHGTVNGARVYKCRCDDCLAASAEYQRDYRTEH